MRIGLSNINGSLVRKLTRAADCPVLVVDA
jgi:hypothetical protein